MTTPASHRFRPAFWFALLVLAGVGIGFWLTRSTEGSKPTRLLTVTEPAGVGSSTSSASPLFAASSQTPAPSEPKKILKRKPTKLADLDLRPTKGSLKSLPAREQARDEMVRTALDLKVEFDPITAAPSYVQATGRFLTTPAPEGTTPREVVAGFIDQHRNLFGHDAEALKSARVTREDVTQHSGMTTLVWNQQVNGIPVFKTILKANVTKNRELVTVSDHFLADPVANITEPLLGAPEALALAAASLNDHVNPASVKAVTNESGAERFRRHDVPGQSDATSQLTYFPMDESQVHLGWDITTFSLANNEMFRLVVDARTGEVLYRTSLTADISDASYRVFTTESPTPLSPGHEFRSNLQPAEVSRVLVKTPALDTSASPIGWINDSGQETNGNNVDAHTDTDADNVADLPRPNGGASRVFDFAMDLTQAPSTYKSASVTQLFYWCNFMHDRLYPLGFTESAGNFQVSNFGRGGNGNDPVLADAQDGSGTNNANFSTPSDGSSGRMQMYLWTGPTPDRDGSFEAEVVLHEYGHGVSNRLVGGGVGISALASRGMGEGWSDFLGMALVADASENPHGNWARGGYSRYRLSSWYTENYYFGGRRYSYSTDMLKNPHTLKDIDPTKVDWHTSVPRNPTFAATDDATEVHYAGTVWCAMLWELRASMILKHGFAKGNERGMQLVLDGMKLSPANPNFVQARDGIVQAAVVSFPEDQGEVWTAFTKRGAGKDAVAPASSTTTGITESYLVPDDLQIDDRSGWTIIGDKGGPFSPATKVITLANYGTATLNWSVNTNATWLSASPSSGTIPAGGYLAVTITTQADSVVPGFYATNVVFSNTTTKFNQPLGVRLYVMPPRVHFFDLSTDPGWTRTGEWDFGTPAGGGGTGGGGSGNPDPTAGATGFNVLGVNLVGNHSSSIGGPYYLTMGPVSLATSSKTRLRFQRWLNTSSATNMRTAVEVSTDGTTWREVFANGGTTITDNAWTRMDYDISSVADHQGTVYVRWLYQNLVASAYSGWNIDDVELLGEADNTLAITSAGTAIEGGSPVTATVTMTTTQASDTTVSLVSSDTTAATVPVSVVILAGQTSATFAITPVNDTIADGPQTTVITASATGSGSGKQSFIVNDNETATLTLTGSTTVSESTVSSTWTVTRSTVSASPITITLSSSNPLAATVPASVVIPANQVSATFLVSPVNDTLIDGSQATTITASVFNWTTGTRTLTVTDNESSLLGITLTSSVTEGSSATGTVNISGKRSSSLTVNLASNQSKLTVPAWVTIPSGSTSASFKATAPNDALVETNATATITASASGFTNGTANTTVIDNDVHHFTFATIGSSQTPNGAFSVTVTARNASNGTATGFVGTVSLSAAGSPNAVTVSPAFSGSFTAGVWTGSATVAGPVSTSVTLSVDDGASHTGTSNVFTLAVGALDHFVIDPLGDTMAGQPFAVTITAVDSGGNTNSNYTGPALLSGISSSLPRTVGTGTVTSSTAPLGSFYQDERTQCIYLQSELGGATRISGLALKVTTVPGQTLNNWTIRMKHTSLSAYATRSWDSSGWTTVYQGNETINSTGMVKFSFSTPFNYDGTSNLMVDFSFNNSSYTTSGSITGTTSSTSRVIYYQTDSFYGDPLTWSGTSNPTPTTSSTLPNLELTVGASVAVSPAQTGSFSQGVWTGDVTVSKASTQMALLVSDGSQVAFSNDFVVYSPVEADNQTVAVYHNVPRAITLTARDTTSPAATLTYALVTNPAHGTLSGTGQDLIYTPTAGYTGADSFTFTAANGAVESLPAAVTIQVAPKLGGDWTLRYPLPTAEHLNAMAVSTTGRVVIVGEHGSIVTSDNQATWTARASGIVQHLRDVVWTGAQFVAVGDAGKILTSPDGASWTQATSPGTDPLLAVDASTSLIVAVGGTSTGVTYTSADGVTWTRHVIAGSTAMKDVLWTGTQFVALINSNALTSVNGVTWVRRVMPCSAPVSLARTPSGGLVVSGNIVCTSSDNGVHWTVRSGPTNLRLAATSAEVMGVASDGKIYSTTNGTTWTTVQAAQGFALRAITRINSTYVAAGQAGVIEKGNPLGTPAVAMSLQPSGRPMVSANAVTWNRSTTAPLYVAVGSGASWTSADGLNWMPYAQTGKTMLAITWTGTCFVAAGSAVWTSTDGVTWIQRVVGLSKTGPTFYGVNYFGTRGYVTGYNPRTQSAVIATSSADGYSWSGFSTLPGGNALISLAYSGRLYVGVGWNGAVFTSTNGTSWVGHKVALASGDYFTDVTTSATGTFVATTYDGDIWTSANGTSWSKRFHASHSLWCVVRSSNEFLAAGNYGTLVHSFDGSYWHEENLGTNTFINQITLAGTQLLAVGGYGAIFNSVGIAPTRPLVNFAQPTASVKENGGPLNLAISLSQAWPLPVTVPLTFAGTASTSDYTRSVSSVTFVAGETTKTLVITPRNDTTVESDETILVTLGSPTGDVAVGSPSIVTVALLNDDGLPPPLLAASEAGSLVVQRRVSGTARAADLPNGVTITNTALLMPPLNEVVSLLGSFVAFAENPASGNSLDSRIDLTSTDGHTFTGKLTHGEVMTPFVGLFDPRDAPMLAASIKVGTSTLKLLIDMRTGELSGELDSGDTLSQVKGWSVNPTPAP